MSTVFRNQCLLAALLTLVYLLDGPAPSPAHAAAGENVKHHSVALVTGSTQGLGEEVALRLGALGFHVIVHGRSVERGEAVAASIVEQGGSAEFRRADFLSLDQVRALAQSVLADFDRLMDRSFKRPLGGGGKVGRGVWPSKLSKSRGCRARP